MRKILTFACISAILFAGGCSETGKMMAFHALGERSKFDCDLASVNDCPRGTENYMDYRDERRHLLKEESQNKELE